MRKTPRSQQLEQQRRWGHGPRHRALGVGLAAAGLLVTAGCSVAPPGAAGTSPAIGPAHADAAVKDFGAFPIPAGWNGKVFRFYEALVKAKVSKKRHNFRIIARADLVFWLSCIGTGTAQFTSPALRFHWSVPCGNGADPAAVNFRPRAAAVGHAVDALVTASPGARWEARIDVPARPGVTPAAAAAVHSAR